MRCHSMRRLWLRSRWPSRATRNHEAVHRSANQIQIQTPIVVRSRSLSLSLTLSHTRPVTSCASASSGEAALATAERSSHSSATQTNSGEAKDQVSAATVTAIATDVLDQSPATTKSHSAARTSKDHQKHQQQQPQRLLEEQQVHTFLSTKPSIRQLEEFVGQFTNSSISESTLRRLVAYYLDPSHHVAGRVFGDIVTSFERLLRQNRDVFRFKNDWLHSHSLELQLIEFASLVRPAHLRSDYLCIVCDSHASTAQNNPEVMALMAEMRLRHQKPEWGRTGDCHWFINNSLKQNLRRQDDPERGLNNSMNLARLLRERWNSCLPPPLWSEMLLRMLSLHKSRKEITKWMQLHPPHEKKTKPMEIVLHHVLTNLKQPALALELLQMYLPYYQTSEFASRQHLSLLRSILDDFLASKPTLQQVATFVSLMRPSDNVFRPHLNHRTLDMLVEFGLDPLHHPPETSRHQIAASFFDLVLNANADMLTWNSLEERFQFGVREHHLDDSLVHTWLIGLFLLSKHNRPLDELLLWLDSQQMNDVTFELKSVVYDRRLGPFLTADSQVTLAMLAFGLKNADTCEWPETRATLLRTLVLKFLSLQPSVDELNDLMKWLPNEPQVVTNRVRSSVIQTLLEAARESWEQASQESRDDPKDATVTPTLLVENPTENAYCHMASSLVAFVQAHHQVLQWPVHRRLVKRAGTLVGFSGAGNCVALAQRFLKLTSDPSDRVAFANAVVKALVRAYDLDQLHAFFVIVKTWKIAIKPSSLSAEDPSVEAEVRKLWADFESDTIDSQAVLATWDRILSKQVKRES